MTIPDDKTTVSRTITVGDGVEFTEFVEIEADFQIDNFRQLEVTLESPSGAVSVISPSYTGTYAYLCSLSRYSCSMNGSFRFGSARHLGENPEGEWKLRITDRRSGLTRGTLRSWRITIYGHRNTPAAPTIDKVAPGNGALTVAWSAPANVGRSSISAHDLRYIRSDAMDKTDDNWTVSEDVWTLSGGGALEHEIDGLLVDTQYDVQVRAVNNDGDGQWSAVESAAASTDKAPFIDSLAPGNGSLSISWSAPTSSELGTVTSYDLRYIRSDVLNKLDTNWSELTSIWTMGTLEYSLGSLSNGVSYDLQIRAVTGSDQQPWSSAHSAIPRTTPSAPNAVNFVDSYSSAPGGRTLHVQWGRPSNGGAPITGYEIRYIKSAATDKADDNWTVELVNVYPVLEYFITEQENGISYDVQVRAVNDADGGSWSGTIVGTPSTKPGSLTIDAITAGSRSITVEWSEPESDGGSDISSYDLRYTKTTDLSLSFKPTTFRTAVWSSGDGDLMATITGLEVGTQYSVQVRAVNAAGAGPWPAFQVGTTALSADAAELSSLILTGATLYPSFAARTTSYKASTGYLDTQITIAATPRRDDSTVEFLDESNQPLTDGDNAVGFQVVLSVGENVVRVRVTASDNVTTKTYTVTVSRAGEDRSLTPSPNNTVVAGVLSTARYTVTFQGQWTIGVTPGGLPGGAHFSPIIGAVHNAEVTFLKSGEAASSGVESMAETGGTSELQSEVNAAINAITPTALSVLSRSGNIGRQGQVTLNDVAVTTDHPRVTLVTMIAPSPDWFVGVSGLSLLDASGNWLPSHEVKLNPWDAGTENGGEFSPSNLATSPHGVITSIAGVGKFSTESIATLTFTLRSANSEPTGAPLITGAAEVGEVLTASTSGIDDADGLTNASFAYQWLADDAEIDGATASTYTLVANDAGKAIKVMVSFTDDAGNDEELTSAATGAVAAAAVVKPPLTATVHGVPSSHNGQDAFTFELRFSEDPKPDFSYTTVRDHAFTVTGGSVTYVRRLEAGENVRWEITVTPGSSAAVAIALNATTDCSATGAICTEEGRKLSGGPLLVVTGPNSPATGVPTISGTAQVGETLTAGVTGISDSDGLNSATFAYQWLADDVEIYGATANSYTLTDTEAGKTIKVMVSFTDDAGNDEHLTSAATGAVAAAAPPPNTPATGAPSITGTAQVGETLTVGVTGISDGDGLNSATFAYQWLADDVEIYGATANSYTLTDTEAGKAIKVRVSFTDDAGNDEELTSAATGAVAAAPPPNTPATGAPSITGTAQVGETLTAGVTGISDGDGLNSATFAYEWLADDVEIYGATASTYTLADAEAGKAIKVRVSFTDDAGNDEELTSAATGAVAAAAPPPNTPATGAPSITGTAQVGETLTAGVTGISDGDGLNSATFAYQWLADDVEINGATASTYTLADAEAGKAIKVRVSFTDDAGNDEELTSAATGAVAAAAVVKPPLTATVHGVPSSHNGQDAFTFELRFSEAPKPDFSYTTVRDHAFTVTGGSVTYVRRLEAGENVRWEITVTPGSSADVAIALNATTDCEAEGAICTEDGKRLSASVSASVSGPASVGTVPVAVIVSGTTPVAEGEMVSFTISLNRAAPTALSVAVSVADAGGVLSGTAPRSVAFATGDNSKTITLPTRDDNAIKTASTVTVSLATGSGYTLGTATSASVSVTDNDTPVWTVEVQPTEIAEGESSTITLGVANGKTFAANQTVSLTVSGSASGSDYSLSDTELTLQAGASSVTATVAANDDTSVESDETVIVTATHDGQPIGSATVTIEDNDVAVWTVEAQPTEIAEGGSSTITLGVANGKTFAANQTVSLAVSGSASGSDYSLSDTELTLQAGASSVTATVTARDDTSVESDETVIVTATLDGQPIGSATVTIEANDTPVWSVVAEPAKVAEGAASTVTVSVDKAFEVAQTITLALGGTATSGDYSLSSSSLTLGAGDTSVMARVTAVDDSDEESDETVVVTASHGGGAVGSATVIIEANDTPVSTDAALSSLALSGVGIGGFDAGIAAYAASVGNGVSSTTVTAVASDDGASVVIADGDGETRGTSRSVSLVVGVNAITVTVTAEDAVTTKTYTITVTRAEPDVAPLPPGVVWGDRLPDLDIALPGVGSPSGVWSDGTDVWVVTTAGKISVYSLADGSEHTDRGFTLPGRAGYAAGLWSDGATLWVADVNGGWVRAYRLSDGARQADRDLNTARNREPTGIWSDGATMWVADYTDSRVYAYDLASKARVADKEFGLTKNPGETYNPFGIWSNGDTLLAASWLGGEIIAHSLADGQRQPAKDLSTFASRTNFPNGIWSNGHILWVLDNSAATLYAYAVPGLGALDTATWSVVVDPVRVAEGEVSTVTVSVDKAFAVAKTITLAVTGGTAEAGDYSLSGSTLTLGVGDKSVTARVTAVDDNVIDGGDETVIVTATHDGQPIGSATVTIEDNDTPVWSVSADPPRVAEGEVSTVTVSVDKAFGIAQAITLAVTGGTAEGGDYSLSGSTLTLDAGDKSVTARVTAVDDNVIDGGDETVIVTATHDGQPIGSATVTIEDNDTPTWSVVADPPRVAEGAVSTITLGIANGKTFAANQTVSLAVSGTASGSDYSLSATEVTLQAGASSVTATVTARDDTSVESDETVIVTATHDGQPIGSATVTIEDNDTPTWSVVADPVRVAEGEVSTVTVSVDKAFAVAQTITLAVTGGTAEGGDYLLSTSTLTLDAGDKSVTVRLTAVDDNDEESDETVVVTASHGGSAIGSATVIIEDNDTPVWSVSADPPRVAEGEVSTVTVSVDKAFAVAQTITMAVTGGTAEGGDYSLSTSTLTLGVGDKSVTVRVTAVDDNIIDGGDETVIVTATHDGQPIGSATVTVEDNDTPTWSVSADPPRVAEGEVSTVTVSVDKAFAVAQTITLAVTGGTAEGGDYSLLPSTLTLDAGDKSATARVTAVDDNVIDGGDETVIVTATHDGQPIGSATVTVEDNDTPTWSVVADPVRVAEGEVSTVTVSVDKAFAVAQTITLAVTGGTAEGGDYSLSGSTLTLDAGDKSVTARVTAVDDNVIDGGDETVIVTATHDGQPIGSATVTIEDNDTPVWSVVAEPAVAQTITLAVTGGTAEGGDPLTLDAGDKSVTARVTAGMAEGAASTVTVSVDKAFAVAQTITLAVTGGTAEGGDYSLLPSTLTLDTGDTSVMARVTAVDDSDEESDETVVVTASHGGGAVGSATVIIEANDTPVSTDAALSSLALSGVDIGGFDADNTAYAASVSNGVSSTTVTAVASDDGASVMIADGDGETRGTSRSVSLVVGVNAITVTITAEDAVTTKTYTITVTRAEPDVAPLPPGVVWGDRLPDLDIALSGAGSPSGVWSNGTDVWVVTTAGKISVYSLADGSEHTDRGFTLPGRAEYAAGLWSDGATLWVADVNGGWVRAYRLSDGARQADRDLAAAAGNSEPTGIWSDGATMWVADYTDSRVYAYDLASKARVADKELGLTKNPGETYNPFGIWSNGDTLLAASWLGGEIIAHSLADGQRQPAKDLSTFASRTNFPNGIWSNGHILWVLDNSAATLYAYAVPGLGAPPNDTAGSGD